MPFSPPSDEICKRIRDTHPEVDPVEFHRFVADQLSQTFAASDGVGDKSQVPRVVEFLLEDETLHFLDSHMAAFKDMKHRQDEIKETLKIKNVLPVVPKKLAANEIDRAIKPGGLTLVHVMVEDRNLAGLKDAHEGHGANLSVRDNSGQLPIDLARALGYVEIVAYIESRLAGVSSAR
jgi:hypothetical protein